MPCWAINQHWPLEECVSAHLLSLPEVTTRSHSIPSHSKNEEISDTFYISLLIYTPLIHTRHVSTLSQAWKRITFVRWLISYIKPWPLPWPCKPLQVSNELSHPLFLFVGLFLCLLAKRELVDYAISLPQASRFGCLPNELARPLSWTTYMNPLISHFGCLPNELAYY